MGGVTMTEKRGRGGPPREHEPHSHGPEGTAYPPPGPASHRQPCVAGLKSRSGQRSGYTRSAVTTRKLVAFETCDRAGRLNWRSLLGEECGVRPSAVVVAARIRSLDRRA